MITKEKAIKNVFSSVSAEDVMYFWKQLYEYEKEIIRCSLEGNQSCRVTIMGPPLIQNLIRKNLNHRGFRLGHLNQYVIEIQWSIYDD